MSTIQEKIFLQQHAARVQGALDSSKAMVEFSKMLLRGTLILNGAAVIPIVYSKVELLYPSAIIFGIGALCSVIASSLAYITQAFVYKTWTPDLFDLLRTEKITNPLDGKVYTRFFWAMETKKYSIVSLIFTILTALFIILSFFAFMYGLYQAYEQIGNLEAVWL